VVKVLLLVITADLKMFLSKLMDLLHLFDELHGILCLPAVLGWFWLAHKQVEQKQHLPTKHHFIRCESSGLAYNDHGQ